MLCIESQIKYLNRKLVRVYIYQAGAVSHHFIFFVTYEWAQ